MKKSIKYLFLAVASVALFACQEPEEQILPDFKEMEVTATTESIGGEFDFTFQDGDQISLFDGSKNQIFTFQGTAFAGTADANADGYVAFYPAQPGVMRYNGKLGVNLPSVQKAVKDGVSSDYYFAAGAAENGCIAFKNALAYLKVTVNTSADIVALRLTATNGEPIAGDILVDVSANPVATANANKTYYSSVGLTGQAINGVYYFAVLPATLANGYTLSAVNSEDSQADVEFPEAISFAANTITEVGVLTDKQLVFAESVNPNPTKVADAVILKASFTEGEFNMLSEPKFDEYLDKSVTYKTYWQLPGDAVAYTFDNGQHGVEVPAPAPGVFYQALQMLPYTVNTTYVATADYMTSTPHTYFSFGFQGGAGDILSEINGPATFEPMGISITGPMSEMVSKTLEGNSGDRFYGYVRIGAWGDAGRIMRCGNFRVIPKGYDLISTAPAGVEEKGTVMNATYDNVTKLGRIMAFTDNDGKVRMALSKVETAGGVTNNGLAIANVNDITNGLQIDKFVKVAGSIANIVNPEAVTAALAAAGQTQSVISIVPDAAITAGGKIYMHMYATVAETDQNNWTSAGAGFLVSEDGGATWAFPTINKLWTASMFREVALCRKDNYIYMIATYDGRAANVWENYFCAKIEDTKDLQDPAQWEFWTGTGWTNDINAVGPSALLITGARSEPCVIWNPKFQRFMMIYNSGRLGGLVYRDAAEIQGPWSGAKVLTDDTVSGVLMAPTAMKVDEETGDVWFIATRQN